MRDAQVSTAMKLVMLVRRHNEQVTWDLHILRWNQRDWDRGIEDIARTYRVGNEQCLDPVNEGKDSRCGERCH